MYEFLENSYPFVLVGFGAIAGSCLRMYLSNYLEYIFSSRQLGTFIVNIISAFFLGLVVALQPYSEVENFDNDVSLFLLICIGFLGSLSTFSAFIIDLLNTLLDKNWKQFLSLAFFSVFGGFFAVAAGLALGGR